MFIGATFYAFEIPNYFDWIVKKTQSLKGIKATLTKTLFIKLFSGQFDAINFNLLEIAFWSFLVNIPISFIANYIIQNRFKLKWRFLGSAIFSAIMAIYYALSETFFS